ncbi:E3 ubiquitin-protein ligase TRIM56 [Ambystoma mexicanum]|uniref:E3 ubiquitin-protein ligase TRIM56 n=1 Tax=Ambystoma mexicanum TaxID=8296 RepID=UPI0037E96A2A
MTSKTSSLSDALTNDFLTCKICLEKFKMPKILPCLHTYCEQCLQEIIENERLRCPECREETQVSQGTGSLKTNFFINSLLDLVHSSTESDLACILCPLIKKDSNEKATSRCLDCSDNMCHTCASGHRYSRLTHDHQIVDIQDYLSGMYDAEIRARHAVKCQKHGGENLRFLCKNCDSLICRECRLDQHLNHDCLSLSEATESRKPVIEGLLKGMEGNLQLISSEKTAVEENFQKVKSQDACIRCIVEETVSRVITHLRGHQQDILKRLDLFVKEEEKAVDLLRSDLDLEELVARSTMTFAEKVLSFGNEIEILSLEGIITERLQQLQKFSWRAVQEASAKLVISGDLNATTNLFQLSLSNSQKQALEDDVVTPKQAARHKDWSDSISISPTPSCLVPKPRFFSSFRVKDLSDARRPRITGICFYGPKEILVADEENRNLKRFSLQGEIKGKIQVSNNKAPCGISCLGKNIVFSAGSQLFLVEGEGDMIWQKALPHTQATHAITAVGTKTVAVSTSGYVDLYNLEGEHVNRISLQEQHERKLVFLTYNQKGEFVASDWYKKNVVVFKESGVILCTCEDKGLEGRLPGAVSVDENGNIFITIHELNKVIMCSQDGKFQGDFLNAKNSIEKPRVTAIHENLFAVALNSGTIHIFKF